MMAVEVLSMWDSNECVLMQSIDKRPVKFTKPKENGVNFLLFEHLSIILVRCPFGNTNLIDSFSLEYTVS
jgi:hypothetical protein